MSRLLRGRIKRLEANQPEEDQSSLSVLEKFERILDCATALADGKPLPHTLTRRQRNLANDYAERFKRMRENEETARSKLAYLLLSERDACLLIGSYQRRQHLQEAYSRALKEENRRAIWGKTGLIGHRERTPEEEARRSKMVEDLIGRAEWLRQEVELRAEREADPLRSWAEAEKEAFYVNSTEYLKKAHPEWFKGR